MKNKPLPFSILALVTLMACASHNQNSSVESYRDNTFLRLLADTTGIVEERLLSADGDNGFVHFYEFYNLLPPDIDFKDENLKYMCDFYNFYQIDNSSFTGYDTYYRARYALGADSLQLLNAWKANLEWLRDRKVCYDSTVQQWLSGAVEARIEVLNSGKADNGRDREDRLGASNIFALITQWNPLNDVVEDSRDSVWDELKNDLSPQNYLPYNFPDVYTTFFNIDTPETTRELTALFKCYNSAKNLDQKAASLFTMMGVGLLHPFGHDTLETFVKEAEKIFESASYSPMLPLLWRAYRCLYNDLYSCLSKDCYCYNQRYNYYRRLIAYIYLRHIEAFHGDDAAKIQYLFLCGENDILKEGNYPYGNQSAAEVINLFWKGVVL